LRVLLVEPPKEFWFLMGEYLAPPFGLLQLAAYLAREEKDVEVQVLDCQARGLDWDGLRRELESLQPDVVASSGLATCNAFIAARTLELAKNVNPGVVTVVGGQHFTATAQESLEKYPEIDVIVRGEGEETLRQLIRALKERRGLATVEGLSFRRNGEVVHNPPRPLIEDLDALPFPGYGFVEDLVGRYHFTMMAGRDVRYALIEGSRGCAYRCSFCTQWRFWGARWRMKSPRRIADEMEFCHREYDSQFLWFTDDNLGLGPRAARLCDELIQRGLGDEVSWFIQARCDDVAKHRALLPRLRKAGNQWILLGVESGSQETLTALNKSVRPEEARAAVRALKENGIFAQATLIIGERRDTAQSIAQLSEFVNDLDADLPIFMILTPFPGSELYEFASRQGWIEDWNWANYDMVHTVMPTETLSRIELQQELYECYRSYYGSWARRLRGLFSPNKLVRNTYRYLAKQNLLMQLRGSL